MCIRDRGNIEWSLKKAGNKKYSVGNVSSRRTVLVDLTETGAKELNKQLLEDFTNVAGRLDCEELCVAVAAKSPAAASMARSLTIFGFAADTKAQAALLTSNPDILIMRMEVNQEDDFVDLY
eukprot:TRINITY_DN1650_c0_g1_i29.p3 TRINITY_DN1650_c0_g1~~TRINITY_DN1650_c0_g1_i29.p3  ORF type:complete len:122 (+),score=49.41 TRINITY_DN1650_c0_g1_i29:72-437(+)